MLNNFTIDSSVFIAALTPLDQFHNDSKKFFSWLEKHRTEITINLPIIVILEVANILKRRNLKKEAEHLIKYSKQDFFSICPLDEAFLDAWFYRSKNLDIKTNDSVIIMTACFTDSILVTTDSKIIKQGQKVAAVFSPRTILNKLMPKNN